MITFSLVPLAIFVGAAFFFSAFSRLFFSLLTRGRKLLYDWDQEVQDSVRIVAQSYTRIRQLINFFFFPFFSTKRFHSPGYKVGIVSYPCLSSCSTGILGLLVASFWGEFQNFYTRNDIMPPIAADYTYIQICWDTHIFSPSNIEVYF